MKKSGLVLMVVGSFLLAFGLLSKYYIYPSVAVAPADAVIDVRAASAPGEDVTYFDIGKLREVQAPFENRTRIRGNVKEAEKVSKQLGEDVVIWDAYACSGIQGQDCLDDRLPIAGSRDVVAMTEKGSKVIAWDGSKSETGGKSTDSPVRGYVYKLPFNVQKRDYPYWNGSLDKQVPITFVGEGKVKGLTVYNYKQVIEPTKVGTIDLPGSLVGSDEATVTGDSIVSSTTTWGFEPETGVAMTTESSINNYVEVDGKKVLTTTRGTLGIDDETVTSSVEEYSKLSTLLFLVRVIIPVVGVALGLALIALGLYLRTRKTNTATATPRRAHTTAR